MARFVASFLNNALLEPIDSIRSFKPFEPIPNKSISMDVAKNRVFLAGNDDGYAQQGGSISLNVQNAPSPTTYNLIASVWRQENSTGVYVGGVLQSQAIVQRIYSFVSYYINIGPSYYIVTFNQSLNQWEADPRAYSLAEITSDILTPFENPYEVDGAPFTGNLNKTTRRELQISAISSITTTIPNPGGSTNWGVVVQGLANAGPTSVAVDMSATLGFMDGTQYKVCLIWYDENLKNAGATSVRELNIPRLTSFQPRQVNYTISAGSSSIPSWAHAVGIGLTRCLNMESFIHHETTDIWYYNGDDDEGQIMVGKTSSDFTSCRSIIIDIYSLMINGIGYVFNNEDADMVEVTIGSTIHSLKIIGQRARYLIVEKVNLGDLAALSNAGGGQIRVPLRIYTPKKTAQQDVFFEVAEMHKVLNPGQVGRSLQTNSGTIPPSTFVIKRNRHEFVGTPPANTNVKLAVFDEPVINPPSADARSSGRRSRSSTTIIVPGNVRQTGMAPAAGNPMDGTIALPRPGLGAGLPPQKDPSSDANVRTNVVYRRAIRDAGRVLDVFAMSASDQGWFFWDDGLGRALVEISEPRSRVNAQEIFPGEMYVPNSRQNTMNEFNPANKEQVPIDIGNVQKISLVDKTSQDEGTVMLAICSNGSASMYLGETVIRDQSGQEILATSQKIIGTIRTFMGRYGTRHPNSVVAADGRMYWWDQTNRCVVRYASNGLDEISKKEMWSYFSDVSETMQNPVMGYDPINRYIFISFKNPNVTWVYSEARERWIGRVSQVADLYGRLFDVPLIAQGNSVKAYRKIGSTSPARSQSWFVEFFASPSPAGPSHWMSMAINGSVPSKVDFTAQGDYLMQSDLEPTDFSMIEGVQYAPILRDVNTPNVDNPLFNGDPLYSVYLKVKVAFNAASSFLNAIWIGHKRSSGPQ